MAESTYRCLVGEKASPERVLEPAFEFLLEREPKESIPSRFDVTVISRYFPSFEKDIGGTSECTRPLEGPPHTRPRPKNLPDCRGRVPPAPEAIRPSPEFLNMPWLQGPPQAPRVAPGLT